MKKVLVDIVLVLHPGIIRTIGDGDPAQLEKQNGKSWRL
jgi:hypothetical protein